MRNPYETLAARAAEDPDGIAFRFPSFAEGGGDEILTYAGLLARADAVAAGLAGRADPGERVVLLYPNGSAFVAALFGCIAAGVVAVPAPPPTPGREQRSLPRLRTIVDDAAPRLIATDRATLPALAGLFRDDAALGALELVATDAAEPAGGFARPARRGELLLLQYTSGSTSAPRGVMVTRDALWHNSEAIRQAWGYGPGSRSVIWVPNFHDDGVVHGIVQPVHAGFPCALMSPLDLMTHPIRWLRAVSEHAATHSGGPNFAYELAVRKTTPEERQGLELGAWRVAYNAAEPVRLDTLRRFHEAFREHGFRWRSFRPSFGLAEATLLVTTGRDDPEPTAVHADPDALDRGRRLAETEPGRGRALVGCGHAVAGTRVEIVDPEAHHPLAEGRIGEVWVASPGVAGGYWNRPDASAETFGATLADGEGPFLRTGDLGFLRGGELFITGRRKDLIVIHGRNIAPQDVEQTVEGSVDGVRPGCVAAFALAGPDGAERLALVAEVAGPADHAATVSRIRLAIAEGHDLPVAQVALIGAGTLPKTSSGKVQRGECRRLLEAEELAPLHAWRLSVEEPRSAADGLIEWLRRFGAGAFDPGLADERRSFSPHTLLELGNRGVFGLQVPARWGGLGLSAVDAARVYEQLGALDLTLASLVCGHNTIGTLPLQTHGTDAQRDALLPALAAGRMLASFALTEQGSGSNPRAITSRAEPAGPGRWRLFGEKMWIGSATWAGCLSVFVSHEGALPDGMTAFLLRPGAPGLRLGPEIPTLGLRGMVQARVRMDGVEVGAADIIGRPGGGMEIAQEALMSARLALSAVCVGGIKRCAQLMERFASRRTISTGVLGEHPVARARLGDTLAAAGALDALLAKLASRADVGADTPQEALLVAKVAASELLWEAADGLVQLLGGRGYADPGHAARILRDARAFRIVEGPTEALTAFLGARAHRQPELASLLAGELFGRPEVAESLRGAMAALFRPGAGFDVRWAHHRLGWLLVDGVLAAAAADAATGHAEGTPQRRAAAWAMRRLERRLAEAREAVAPPSTGELRAELESLGREVGEPDWAWIGEEREPDPILRAAEPSPAHPIPRAHPQPMLPVAPNDPAEAVASWLRAWISTRLGVAREAVEADLPFHYHGVDSVTSSEMVMDLGRHLGRPLSPTLLWAYPSVSALARHLTG